MDTWKINRACYVYVALLPHGHGPIAIPPKEGPLAPSLCDNAHSNPCIAGDLHLGLPSIPHNRFGIGLLRWRWNYRHLASFHCALSPICCLPWHLGGLVRFALGHYGRNGKRKICRTNLVANS